LKLIQLHYETGNVFGLIRVSQTFVAAFPSHKSHKDVMLKLMDGLLVTGRNKEVIAAARQFLVRYPNDPACNKVEQLLAQLLTRSSQVAPAAVVNEAHWHRAGATPEGAEAGLAAIAQNFSLN